MTLEEKDRRLQERFGETKEAVVAAFRKAYPDRDPVDAICVDSWIRSNSLRYLGLRSREGGAPVFSYLFAFDNGSTNGFDFGEDWWSSNVQLIFDFYLPFKTVDNRSAVSVSCGF